MFENVLIIDGDSLMAIYTGIEQVESNCLNRLLHEVLGYALAIILTIFFCKVRIFPVLEELPQKIIPYSIMKWKYA